MRQQASGFALVATLIFTAVVASASVNLVSSSRLTSQLLKNQIIWQDNQHFVDGVIDYQVRHFQRLRSPRFWQNDAIRYCSAPRPVTDSANCDAWAAGFFTPHSMTWWDSNSTWSGTYDGKTINYFMQHNFNQTNTWHGNSYYRTAIHSHTTYSAWTIGAQYQDPANPQIRNMGYKNFGFLGSAYSN